MPVIPLFIAPDHPCFAGHFPQQPIVPGVVLLDLCIQAIASHTGLQFDTLPVAKFLSPAVPGDALDLEFHVQEDAIRFEIRCGLRKLATGQFHLERKTLA